MVFSDITMSKLRKKATKLGITPGKMNKVDIIRSIQQAEGFQPCFASCQGECLQTECLYHKDCIKAGKKVMAAAS